MNKICEPVVPEVTRLLNGTIRVGIAGARCDGALGDEWGAFLEQFRSGREQAVQVERRGAPHSRISLSKQFERLIHL